MHSRLDSYLHELETKLRSLSTEQRESDMAEIRQHLEALVAAYRELDCAEDEAVTRAIQQFGASKTVAENLLSAARRPDRRQAGVRLCYAGWGLFLLSLCLPAMNVLGADIFGFQCALFVFSPSFPLISSGSWGLWYYHGLGLANILMLASPLILTLLKRNRHAWIVPTLLGLSAAAITPLLFSSGWEIGFYVWFASFGLMAAGSICQTQYCVNKSLCHGMIEGA